MSVTGKVLFLQLWVAAAQFELENGGADNGRQILLRGIRHHPKSRLLYRYSTLVITCTGRVSDPDPH